jgi:type VI secretion system protein ImpL
LILAAVVWWIGPMVAIGRYHPFGWLWLRQLLVVLLLLWGFYPMLRWMLGKFLSLFTRRKHKAPPSNNDRISSRLADLELTLRKIWVDRQKGFFHRLMYRVRNGHLREQPWFNIPFLLLKMLSLNQQAVSPYHPVYIMCCHENECPYLHVG